MKAFSTKTQALKFISEWMSRDGFKYTNLQIQISYAPHSEKYLVDVEHKG